MAQIIGAFRLGRDAELRTTPKGESVANLALAFNYGNKQEDGNRPSQWIEAALWGKRAEALEQYLVKGGQIYAVLADPHIETYEGKNGTGTKLVAKVLEIELIGSRQSGGSEQRQSAAPRQPAPQRQAAAPRQSSGGSGFDDMDSDIPF